MDTTLLILMTMMVILCISSILKISNESFVYLYSDETGNLSATSNISIDSVSVTDYGNIQTKMQNLQSEIETMIRSAKSNMDIKINEMNSSLEGIINPQNQKITNEFSAISIDSDLTTLKSDRNDLQTGINRVNTLNNVARKDKSYKIKLWMRGTQQHGDWSDLTSNDNIANTYAWLGSGSTFKFVE